MFFENNAGLNFLQPIYYYNYKRSLPQAQCLKEIQSVFGLSSTNKSIISKWYNRFDETKTNWRWNESLSRFEKEVWAKEERAADANQPNSEVAPENREHASEVRRIGPKIREGEREIQEVAITISDSEDEVRSQETQVVHADHKVRKRRDGQVRETGKENQKVGCEVRHAASKVRGEDGVVSYSREKDCKVKEKTESIEFNHDSRERSCGLDELDGRVSTLGAELRKYGPSDCILISISDEIQIKLEPTDLEAEPEPEIDDKHEEGSTSDNIDPELHNGEQSFLVPEVRIKPEPMEEVYNELPPEMSTTPHTPQFNLLDSEDSQNSIPCSVASTPFNSRKCRFCSKMYSSTGNRLRHEKLIHGMNTPGLSSSDAEAASIGDDSNSVSSQDNNESEPGASSVRTLMLADDTEHRKIQFAAGLKLLQKDTTPISMESLSKIELSYIEKCKAMVNMFKTLECACHQVNHPNVKGMLSHLRAQRIWFPVFTCYSCMITYTDRSSFTRHNLGCKRPALETLKRLSNLKKRSGVKTRLYQNYKCTSCKYMYSFHEEFCKHVDEEHPLEEGPPYICSCGRSFNDADEYKDHIYVSCLVEYYCDICFVTVNTLDAFLKHAQEVHDNSEGFILLQDDNYKIRRSLQKEKMEKELKEVKKEEAIVTGKRRSSFYNKHLMDSEEEVGEPKRKTRNSGGTPNSKKPDRCPICHKEYSNYHNMLRHYKTHTESDLPPDDSLYSCPDCGGMFNTFQWQKHLFENHESKTCGECGKVFQFQTELDQHRSVHLNLKISRDSKTKSYTSTMVSPNSETSVLLICNICDMVFPSKEELKKHRTSCLSHEVTVKQEHVDVPQNESKYSCMQCNKHYTGYSGLWEHNKKKHPTVKAPASKYPRKCNYCDKVCTTGAAFYIHNQMHERMNHIAGKQGPKAEKNNSKPLLTPKRERHVDEEAQDEENESYHTCKKCFKVFSSKYNLKNHMKCHGLSPSTKSTKSGAGPKKVWCDVCHTSCESADALAQHKEEEHALDEDMPDLDMEIDNLDSKIPFIFTCDYCTMTFTKKTALQKHKETHKQERAHAAYTSNENVYCKYCKIPFETVASLAYHMKDEHDEVMKIKGFKQKDKSFVCGECHKGFHSALALNAHVGWHKRTYTSSVKPLKAVKQESEVASVSGSQVGSSKVQCTTCKQTFPNDTAMQIHILEKHRNIDAIMLIPRCNICNQDFNNQDEYEKHKRLHDLLERQKKHKKMQQAAAQQSNKFQKVNKTFRCSRCSAVFHKHDAYITHMRHNCREVNNEFKCLQCDRTFERQNALTLHLKMHDKQKAGNVQSKALFSCSICNMGFDLPKDLRTHTINAHPF